MINGWYYRKPVDGVKIFGHVSDHLCLATSNFEFDPKAGPLIKRRKVKVRVKGFFFFISFFIGSLFKRIVY
jgi:hypothetical protein